MDANNAGHSEFGSQWRKVTACVQICNTPEFIEVGVCALDGTYAGTILTAEEAKRMVDEVLLRVELIERTQRERSAT